LELLSVEAFDCGFEFLGATTLLFADFLGATIGLFVEPGLLPAPEFVFVTTVDFSEIEILPFFSTTTT
jgi:hypothetical protein